MVAHDSCNQEKCHAALQESIDELRPADEATQPGRARLVALLRKIVRGTDFSDSEAKFQEKENGDFRMRGGREW